MSQIQLSSSEKLTQYGLLRRLLTLKSLLVTSSAFTLITLVLRAFNFGVQIVDWAQRYEFIHGRKGLLFDFFTWLLSPTGLNVLLVLAVTTVLISIYFMVSAKPKSLIGPEQVQPTLEILSPFDNEEVGLYETVRGRVFPPDQDLQVVVYAPDNKWYPQKQVNVKEGFWHVKCQFGQLEGRGGDPFKIIAVAGNGLAEGMWYSDLPDGIRSNIIRVRRQEVTIEQKLARALADAKNAQLQANQEKGTKDSIYELYRESERKLASLTWLSQIADQQSKNIAEHVKTRILQYPHPGELVLSSDHLCALVGLSVRNESVFAINIRAGDMSGRFSLNNRLLDEPAGVLIDEFRGDIVNLEPMKETQIILKQALRQSDKEEIQRGLANANGSISIGNIQALISVQNDAFTVPAKPLRLVDTKAIPLSDFYCNTKSLDG